MDESHKLGISSKHVSTNDPLKGAEFINSTYLGMREFSDVLHYGVLPLITWRPPGMYIDRVKQYRSGSFTDIVAIDYKGHFVYANSGSSPVDGAAVTICNPETGESCPANVLCGENTGKVGRIMGGGCSSHMLWSIGNMRYATSFESYLPRTVIYSRIDIVNMKDVSYIIPYGTTLKTAPVKHMLRGRWITYDRIGADIIYACSRINTNIIVHIVNTKYCKCKLEFTIPNTTGRMLLAAMCASYIVTVEINDNFYVMRIHDMQGDILCTKRYGEYIHFYSIMLAYPQLDKFALIHRDIDSDTTIDVYQINSAPDGVWLEGRNPTARTS